MSPDSGVLTGWMRTMRQLVAAWPEAWDTGTASVSPRDLLLACDLFAMRMWAKTSGAYLDRYKIESGAVHRTDTSVVLCAQDMKKNGLEVALKFIREPQHFASEIFGRFSDEREDPNALDAAVIRIIGWHVPHPHSSRKAYERLHDLDTGRKLLDSLQMDPGSYLPVVIGGLDNVDSLRWRCRLAECTGTDNELSGGLAPFDQYREYPYVLVLARGDRSLHDVCAKEQIAGHDVAEIRKIISGVSKCLAELHSMGIVHGDVKQRNVLRQSGTDHANPWILCDMDASVGVGSSIGAKSSSAYWPPELAQLHFSRCTRCSRCSRCRTKGESQDVLAGATSFDVWSLGVIIFEMCSGQSLFGQDTGNDQLVNNDDKVRLCTWYTISDHELDPVGNLLKDDFATDADVEAARNLIRWCLKGDPADRPTMKEVLQHPFLTPSTPLEDQAMFYHGFLSHAQRDASSTAAALSMLYGQFGLHTWVDMRQELLTLEGMRHGVLSSAVFILILSEHILDSWYCCQELLCAIEAKKPVQLVIEEEERFHPFDLEAWNQSKAALSSVDRASIVDEQCEWQVEAGADKLVQLIEQTIDAHLPNAIVYRRRGFEVKAMMRELCVRAPVQPKILLPVEPRLTVKRRLPVLVIYNSSLPLARKMVAEVKTGLLHYDGIDFCDESKSQEAARVLLILTKGVLKPPALKLLKEVLTQDEQTRSDRLVCLYSEKAGWTFKDNQEKESAEQHVQRAIDGHEALSYRPKTDGMSRHEFPALLIEVAKRLGLYLTT